MNLLEKQLQLVEPALFVSFKESKKEVEHLLDKYSVNFPNYTDHSTKHTLAVFDIAADILTKSEINALNGDEIYILSMGCLLHDIGMCIPPEEIKNIQVAPKTAIT